MYLTVALAMAACGAREPMPEPVPDTVSPPMPEVRVEQVAGGDAIPPETVQRPETLPTEELAALQRGEPITLTAQDTDLRALLAALAEAAEVNLVVSPEVEGRVTVHLQDMPAREALETVIRESGNMITEPLRPLWGPVVFYVAPGDIDEMTAAEIQAHFGVSEALARFIVRARVPR
jgi:type II secretory pathway component HofQ